MPGTHSSRPISLLASLSLGSVLARSRKPLPGSRREKTQTRMLHAAVSTENSNPDRRDSEDTRIPPARKISGVRGPRQMLTFTGLHRKSRTAGFSPFPRCAVFGPPNACLQVAQELGPAFHGRPASPTTIHSSSQPSGTVPILFRSLIFFIGGDVVARTSWYIEWAVCAPEVPERLSSERRSRSCSAGPSITPTDLISANVDIIQRNVRSNDAL